MPNLEEQKDIHKSDELSMKRDNLIQHTKETLEMYLKIHQGSREEENEMINMLLDSIDHIKNIDPQTLDEKDKIFLSLLERSMDIISSLDKFLQSPKTINKDTVSEYYTKQTDFERDWSYAVFDLLLWKDINILDNKLWLDIQDFARLGCLLMSQYRNKNNEVYRHQQLVDFMTQWNRVSPLLVVLIKTKSNNHLSDDVFAKRLIKNFNYLYELYDSDDPYCVGYISLILCELWCSNEQISYIQKKYYWISPK